MKKSVFLLVGILFFVTNSYAQQRTILIYVYVMGLGQPVKCIVNSELATREQLDAVIRAIQTEFIDSDKFGSTPIYAILDHMIEDIKASDIPKDSEVILLLYTDGSNSTLEPKLFKSPESKQYANNPNILDKYIRSKLHAPINGKQISVVPIFAMGKQKESDIPFLQSLSSIGERLYRFEDEADLIRKKLFNTLESSSLVLSIALDHSGSMQSISRLVGYHVIETIEEIFKITQNDLGISLDDFLDSGGSAFVGTTPPVRPDEIYFTFELSPFRIMKSPVLQKQYNKFLTAMGRENPSKILGEDRPQTNVSYFEILEFINWLNTQWNGQGTFRLPTEYELEHVTRLWPPGFSRGDPIVREFCGTMYADYDASEKIDPKGKPSGTHVVVRNTSYEDSDPMMNRPEYRGRIAINEASPLTGFRLVLSFD
jgi:hypothetical protein